jgi:hypothetical protein
MSKCLRAGMRIECVEAGMARRRAGKPRQQHPPRYFTTMQYYLLSALTLSMWTTF